MSEKGVSMYVDSLGIEMRIADIVISSIGEMGSDARFLWSKLQAEFGIDFSHMNVWPTFEDIVACVKGGMLV